MPSLVETCLAGKKLKTWWTGRDFNPIHRLLTAVFFFVLLVDCFTRVKSGLHPVVYQLGKESDKTKATTAILLTAFLSSMLSMPFVTPAMAENPAISEVERCAGEYWFHLVTGQYPNGVWARDWYGEPKYYEEEGYLGLTYRNLSPEMQQIRLTTSPGANHAFWHWPEKTAYEVWLEGDTGTTWIIWPVPPDEWLLMTDLWFIGWGAGEQIHVTLEYTYCIWWPVPPEEWTLVYDGYMTIMPLGP